jgi:hypothetical protein
MLVPATTAHIAVEEAFKISSRAGFLAIVRNFAQPMRAKF